MMMFDPKTVQILFADLQPQIVAPSKTNPPHHRVGGEANPIDSWVGSPT